MSESQGMMFPLGINLNRPYGTLASFLVLLPAINHWAIITKAPTEHKKKLNQPSELTPRCQVCFMLILQGGTLKGVSLTASDAGSYLVRAVARHAADENITAASEAVGFTVNSVPDPITGVDFQVSRYSREGLTLLFQDADRKPLLYTLPLVAEARETVNALLSKWKIYDAGSGELLLETPFRVKVSLDLTGHLGKRLKIAADLITTLSRPVTGEKSLDFSDIQSVTGAVPKVTVNEKRYAFSLACNTKNGCLSDLSDPLYATEKIKALSWTLYKVEDGAETEVLKSPGRTLSHADYAGGDFRAAVELTTTSRTISGEKSFNVTWPLTDEQKAPIAAAVFSRSSTAYLDRPVGVYLILENPRQKGAISNVEWFASAGGASFELLAEGAGLMVSHTPQEAGDLTFKAKIYNKYFPENIYETAPFTLPVDGLNDITSASVAIERIDLDKLRYTITDLPLALELKERLSQGTVTLSGQSGTTYASAPFALRGVLDARETLNEPLSVTFQATTTLGRNIILEKDFDATIADPYVGVTSLSSLPFDPQVEFALSDWTTLTYGVRVKGINYYLVKKYQGAVKLYANDALITNDPGPEWALVQFATEGQKSLAIKLLDSSGNVVAEKALSPLEVISLANAIGENIAGVTLSGRTLDPVARVVKIAANLNEEVLEVLKNKEVYPALNWGIRVYNSPGSSVLPSSLTFEGQGHGIIDFATDAVGSFEAVFYVTYGETTFESPAAPFTLDDVLEDLELFEIEVSQITKSSGWGSVYITITPQLAYGQMKEVAWKVHIADARGEKLVEYGPKTKIGHGFQVPGPYSVVLSAYRKADNTVYYSRELPFEVTNELPQATAVAANVRVDRRGRYIFSAAVAYSDPDSRRVAISWKICGQDYPRAVRKVAYLIGDFGQCGETYFTLDDGIGTPVRYDLNIHELITKASS